jgi:DnaJ-class molecular chaperone
MQIVKILEYNDFKFPDNIEICSKCKGLGEVYSNKFEGTVKCSLCNGTGRTKNIVVKAEIKVPFNYEFKEE